MLLLVLLSGSALRNTPAAGPSAATAEESLPSVTIEARRHSTWQRARIFVDHVVVRRGGESFPIWHEPLCLRIVGVADEQEHFIRSRLTQIVTDAGAQVAPAACSANFHLIVTAHPRELIAAWIARHDGAAEPGWHAQKRRLEQARAVRVWYDVDLVAAEGSPLGSGCAGVPTSEARTLCGDSASRLRFNSVGAFRAVVVIVDRTLAVDFRLGQLVDYIGLVGLVRLDLDADATGAPTLLTLFRAPREDRLQGLTEWDTAFLAALYQTDSSARGQDSDIARRMAVTLTH
jgi:hypothetical protein